MIFSIKKFKENKNFKKKKNDINNYMLNFTVKIIKIKSAFLKSTHTKCKRINHF